MISYEELVVALANWRARRGLPTSLGDYLGEPSAAPATHASSPPDHSHDDVVEIGDELLDGVVEVSDAQDDSAYGRRKMHAQDRGQAGQAASESRADRAQEEKGFPGLGEELTELDDMPTADRSHTPAGKPHGRSGRGTGRRRKK